MASDSRPVGAPAKKLVLAAGTLLLALAVAHPAWCEVALTLSLDRSDATPEDSMVLSVSVSGAHGDDARPSVRGLEDFHVRPAGTSTRVEIVNGRYSAGADFQYLLQPKKTGTFSIGPAEVTVDGTTYRSNVATVTVGQPAAAAAGDRGPVFLVATLAPAQVYVEQRALYTIKLYRSVNIADVSVDIPAVDGIALEKIGEAREYQGHHQGRPYQIIEVRYRVSPHRAGEYTLPATRMSLTVFTPQSRVRRGIFDDPFFGRGGVGRPQTLTSEPLALRVVPIPRQGRPADYGGLVGSFTLESTVEPRELKAGESVTLTATMRGRGNAERLPELKIPPLDGVKVYADQPVLKEETDGEGAVVTKTVKWALVPERAGRYVIPPLTMSFFDPETGRYRTLRTAEAAVSVAPGETERAAAPPPGSTEAALPTPTKRPVAELGSDILPVHTEIDRPASGGTALPGGVVFWLLVAGPPAAFLLTLGGAAVRRRSGRLVAAWEARSAAAAFARTCGGSGLTAEGLLLALQEYLSRRLGLARGSRTADEAAALLRARDVDAGVVGELQSVWRRVEDAVYSGKGSETTEAGAGLARLVARIERDLR